MYNPKTLKQIAIENNNLDDKGLDKKLAKQMINPYHFIDENLKIDFKINLDSHNVNHAKFLLTIEPYFPDFGIETRYFNKIRKELAIKYARLINQIKIIYHSFFQLVFIRLMKKIREVMKLNYSLI